MNSKNKKNVIILTSGLTGSSVLTGLISRAGYWTGETHKKEDYDTYENKKLIELNCRLFELAGFRGNYLTEFSPESIERISGLYGNIDTRPFQDFVEQCNSHGPWIWKDPRLWMTAGFWSNLLDLNGCDFILLTRGYLQCWTSAINRRQIRSYTDSKAYEQSVQREIVAFLSARSLPYIQVGYEELIVNPAATIDRLNGFLGASLTVGDLQQIYHKPLYKNPRSSWLDVAKAVLIYVKNYSERVDALPQRR